MPPEVILYRFVPEFVCVVFPDTSTVVPFDGVSAFVSSSSKSKSIPEVSVLSTTGSVSDEGGVVTVVGVEVVSAGKVVLVPSELFMTTEPSS